MFNKYKKMKLVELAKVEEKQNWEQFQLPTVPPLPSMNVCPWQVVEEAFHCAMWFQSLSTHDFMLHCSLRHTIPVVPPMNKWSFVLLQKKKNEKTNKKKQNKAKTKKTKKPQCWGNIAIFGDIFRALKNNFDDSKLPPFDLNSEHNYFAKYNYSVRCDYFVKYDSVLCYLTAENQFIWMLLFHTEKLCCHVALVNMLVCQKFCWWLPTQRRLIQRKGAHMYVCVYPLMWQMWADTHCVYVLYKRTFLKV